MYKKYGGKVLLWLQFAFFNFFFANFFRFLRFSQIQLPGGKICDWYIILHYFAKHLTPTLNPGLRSYRNGKFKGQNSLCELNNYRPNILKLAERSFWKLSTPIRSDVPSYCTKFNFKILVLILFFLHLFTLFSVHRKISRGQRGN